MGSFTFRSVTRDDFPLLGTWLAEPHVARWWNHETSATAVERDFGALGGRHRAQPGPPGAPRRCRDRPAAAVPLRRPPSIDYLIGEPDRVGRGSLEPDNPIDDPMHEVLRLDRPQT